MNEFEQRREFATALCVAVGINPSDCTSIALEFGQDGSTEVTARLIPRDLRPLTEVVQRLELFPELVNERRKQLEGLVETTAVTDAAIRRAVASGS